MNLIFKMILLSICILSLNAKEFKTKILAQVDTVVWGMSFISDTEMLLTLKNGKIKLLNIKTQKLTSIDAPMKSHQKGQGGLLDIKTSPNFKDDSFVYFTYSKKQRDEISTTLARAKFINNSFSNFEELLVSKNSSNTGFHFGSRITFDDKGHVFFSIGDRGVRKNSQNLKNHSGTIIRLNLDGSIPKDNPFINNANALDEIYSYGHRNPQGLFYDIKKQKLYSNEHGPRGGDEINLVLKGKNYGWPTITYGKEYYGPISIGEGTHKKGMLQPIKTYIPSIAPSSLLVYSGKLFKQFEGDLFSGALKLRHLNRVVLDKNDKVLKEERLLKNLEERIRNVIEGPKGYIYISTDSGKIIKLSL